MIKKYHLTHITLACLLAATCSSALAEKTYKLKPGLWKIESRTRLFGRDVPYVSKIIALGPEALQAHVQDMLRQNRIKITDDGNATICVTAKQIAKNDFVNDEGSGCIVGKGMRTGNTIHYDINCTAPKGNGHTEVDIISRTRWVSSTALQLSVRNMQQTVANESIGTWLSATCPAGQ